MTLHGAYRTRLVRALEIQGAATFFHLNRFFEPEVSPMPEAPPKPGTAAVTGPTLTSSSLKVRPDLYDEDYSEAQYDEMMKLYEGTLQSIAEGEIVKSKVLRVTDTHVILD